MEFEVAREVKRYAIEELGVDLVGIATAAPPASANRLTAWLAAGRHGEMHFMAETSAVRLDPRRFLPGARSVVCVALGYHADGDGHPPETSPGQVLVARYARRRDYHDVLRPRLVRLGKRIAEMQPGSSFRAAVDTAPLLEKALAARAGLGWIGRNTLLVNRDFGSELLLGEVVTTAVLAADRPEPERCGNCRACIDACPTRALVAPFELDARRCISYLTLEHTTDLPDTPGLRTSPYLAGCDACQLVCPWNRAAAPRRDAALAPRPGLGTLTGASLERLDPEGWQRLAAGTPLRRLGYERFRRNLAALAAAAR